MIHDEIFPVSSPKVQMKDLENVSANELDDPIYRVAKRLMDVTLGIVFSIIAVFPSLLIAALIKVTSPGPVLHWSRRVGRENRIFLMPKFRTMRLDTPQLATHLLEQSGTYITPLGRWLRKSSLDELPQLYSILKGDLSFVGPRPALFNQNDLVTLRTENRIHFLMPGLTGWAQINGRDELSIPEKVAFEKQYLAKRSLIFDVTILVKTFAKALKADGVVH